MSNRDECLADIRTTLAGVPGVVTVSPSWADPAELGTAQLPWIAVYAADPQPPSRQEYGSQRLVSLAVTVFVVVALSGATEAERAADREDRLGDLDEAIEDALISTPTRGGYAIDTIRTSEPSTDEGLPPQQGSRGGRAWMGLTYTCRFVPGESATP